MTWALVGKVTDVRNDDDPASCLVRDHETGRDAWYRVAAQVEPPLRVGEWVRVIGGGDPDEPSSTYPAPQVVGRVPAPPIPTPLAVGVRSPGEPSGHDRTGTVHIEHTSTGIRVTVTDPSRKTWSVVRRDGGGWTGDAGEEPRTLTAEAYAALDALVAVFRLAMIHL